MNHRPIVAVIVTYNPVLTELAEQLTALLQEGMQVILVENASTNAEAIEQLARAYDSNQVELIRNSENIGLAAAQNQGIAHALSADAGHVIFFDQDSVPEKGFLQELLRAEALMLEQSIHVAAVGPTTYDPTNGQVYPVTRYVGPFIRRHYPSDKEILEATFLIASGCLVRREVLERVGNMREELFIDYIDVEWSLRAQHHGFKCFVVGSARMSHRIGDNRVKFFGRTISAHSPLRRYYLVRNSFLMLRLSYIPYSYKAREIALNIARILAFLYISNSRREYLTKTRRAVIDGLRGKFGKYQEPA